MSEALFKTDKRLRSFEAPAHYIRDRKTRLAQRDIATPTMTKTPPLPQYLMPRVGLAYTFDDALK